jgi:hypothetical protein
MVFEVKTAEIIQHTLPEIARQLARIADALEARNKEPNNTEDKGK